MTIPTPVPTEYSPDANGRYGLLTWNKTGTQQLPLQSPSKFQVYKVQEVWEGHLEK